MGWPKWPTRARFRSCRTLAMSHHWVISAWATGSEKQPVLTSVDLQGQDYAVQELACGQSKCEGKKDGEKAECDKQKSACGKKKECTKSADKNCDGDKKGCGAGGKQA